MKVRQNVVEDAENPLRYWMIQKLYAEHVEPEVWVGVWPGRTLDLPGHTRGATTGSRG